MLDDEILLSESDFLCFHFPIEYHKITPVDIVYPNRYGMIGMR